MVNYTADPLNIGSLDILVGVFIDTAGTNSPPPTSEKMRSSDYSFALTDVTLSNRFTVQRAIAATNGVWQGKPLTIKILDTTMIDSGGWGLFDNNHISVTTANSVTGNGLSSAIQISLNQSQLASGDTLSFEMTGPTSVNYADNSVHTLTGNPEDSQVNVLPSGSIHFLPEPSTLLLVGPGLLVLMGIRRCKTNGRVSPTTNTRTEG